MIKDRSIFIKNIYYMLSYAFEALNRPDYEDIAKEEFEDMHNLLAAILAKGIGKQLKQGLYREYMNYLDVLPVMRGKIEMSGTIKNKIDHKRVLSCNYDNLSENNLLNQVLKTTVMLLLHHTRVEAKYKDNLKKEMLFFSNVDALDPASIKWPSIRFHRNNHSYRILINICQLIMEGMLLTTDQGKYKLATFVNENHMHRLYEKFILEYYIKEYPQIRVEPSQIKWALDDDYSKMLPIMQSDITLSRSEKVLIIDAKYYSRITQERFGTDTLHSNNLYQIFTYVKNKDSGFGDNPHEVSGMLLYARTDGPIQPNNTYLMSGNMIRVKTLDLNCEFAEISQQLNSIVEEYFGI